MQSGISQLSFRTGITRRTFLGAATAALLPRIGHTLSAYSTREQTVLTDALQNTSANCNNPSPAVRQSPDNQWQPRIHGHPRFRPQAIAALAALQQNLIAPTTTVFCRRDLHIDNQSYPCTHPQSNISLTAQEALAYSCNTWFASLARVSRIRHCQRGPLIFTTSAFSVFYI
jgi:hypothetical protein